MNGAYPLETRDLLIRETTEADLEQFYQWELQPQVHAFFSISEGQSRQAVEETFRRGLADPEQRQYTVLLRATQKPIGRVMLAGLMEGWKVEIFRIYIGDLTQRGKGYGRQTMQAMLRLCFQEWGMERVYLDHYTGNPAALLYQSLGFQYEGILRKNCRKDGVLHDVHLMSMLREEFLLHSKDWD